ncbi:MAG: hypothetical protein GY928_08075 [Colwellia sp.]|nr:hypothetical protein [Colwellia sp.]
MKNKGLITLVFIYVLILSAMAIYSHHWEIMESVEIERMNRKVNTAGGLFSYYSDVYTTLHVDMSGNDYMIVKLYSNGNLFHFDQPIPSHERDIIAWQDSFLAQFHGGSL